MSGAATKKRKVGVASPPTIKKLTRSIDSLMARLEATNAYFLQHAATSAIQARLAKPTALKHAALSTSPSLASLPVDHKEVARRLERQQRFKEEKVALAAAAGIKEPGKTLVALRSEQGIARGQNQSLEKDYMRLTTLPSAADVRPPEVLHQALELVKRRWTEGWEYKEACNQLKSIRQDLTVQHIRTTLTVQVYETHARIAIEVSDWAEYMQCHSVLQQLFADGLRGEQREFTAYGLLYAAATGRDVLSHEMSEAFPSGSSSSSGGLAVDRFVRHALAVCRAYLGGDFVCFLQLYEDAPRMAPYLMDLLLAKLRGRAYNTVLAAFMPSIPLAALSGWFGFSKRKEATAFLRERGAVVVNGCLDIKESRAAQQRQQQQQGVMEGLQMTLVNRHWCEAMRGSLTLWTSAKLDLVGADGHRMASILTYVTSRSQGIRALEVSFDLNANWSDLAFMLGVLRTVLRRCCLVGLDPGCELLAGSGAFLCQLRSLTSLDLDNCCMSLPAGISQLMGLQELLVSREDGPTAEFEVPSQLSCLQQLTRLELVRCTTALPVELSILTHLRLLNVEGSNLNDCLDTVEAVLQQLTLLEELDLGGCSLPDLPSTISVLTNLTTLSLNNTFQSSWSATTFDAKLSVLSGLQGLLYLELSECELTSLPSPVTSLKYLETLKLGLNPLLDLPSGPYMANLLHLDLRGTCIVTLPQHLVQAQHLQFLGLSCCHDLVLDSTLAEHVLGKLSRLETITLCGQQMNTVDSARCLLQLGKMLPDLQVSSHDEVEEEDNEEDSEEDDNSELETDLEEDFTTDEEGFPQPHSDIEGSDAETAYSDGSDASSLNGWPLGGHFPPMGQGG